MAKIVKSDTKMNILKEYYQGERFISSTPYKEFKNNQIHVIEDFDEIEHFIKQEFNVVVSMTTPLNIVKTLAQQLCFIDGYAYDYKAQFGVVQYPVINQDNICNKCNGIGKPSKAFINIHNIQTQDVSKEFETKLIDCIKCEDCGHSWK